MRLGVHAPLKEIAAHLPYPVLSSLRGMRDVALGTWYRGEGRWCPVCEHSSRKFRSFGEVRRQDAKCPRCGALERHRLTWLYLCRCTDLFDGRAKRVLHVAPEQWFEGRLKKRLGAGYLTADLVDPHAMERMDITRIPYPDETFDVVYCSHVLEHVPDDRRAMREFRRVLKPQGWAILLVPISASHTLEDPTITDSAERRRLFGQADHVRRYGPDYTERLQEAGFRVTILQPWDIVARADAVRMGIGPATGEIYRCTPSADAAPSRIKGRERV
jgi:hypothetical protein